MSEIEENLSLYKKRRANLTRLADYLATGQTAMEFDMWDFCRQRNGDSTKQIDYPAEHRCGTVACALGHGPAAGIEPDYGENWWTYAQRFVPLDDIEDTIFQWIFGSGWRRTDNTPQGVAARIRWYLEKGVPEDALSQMSGVAPLCYEVPA